MSTKNQLIKIATKVREWAEAWNRINDKFSDDLCGMCAIAAAELHTALTIKGYEPLILVDDRDGDACHCFVVCDGYLVDVTATQFRLLKDRPVIVEEYSKATKLLGHYAKANHIYENSRQLNMYQRTTDWPIDQICNPR